MSETVVVVFNAKILSFAFYVTRYKTILHVFASVASKNVLHMNAEQRAICKCELNITINGD